MKAADVDIPLAVAEGIDAVLLREGRSPLDAAHKALEVLHSIRRQHPAALIADIVRSLVDHPEQVKLTEVGGSEVVILELFVAKPDRAHVIGRNGRMAAALRTILGAASQGLPRRYTLTVLDGTGEG